MDAIGPELFALVHHLYKKCPTAADAVSELTLRTYEKFERADVAMAPTAKEIAYTRWFNGAKQRYKTLREQLASRPEAKEAEEVIVGLYPSGCSTSQLPEAFSTATDMLTFRVNAARASEAGTLRAAALEEKKISKLNGKDLVKEYLSAVIIPALIPAKWWQTQPDAAKRSILKVSAVGLRLDPPSLVIEYRRQDDPENKRRHRTIYLHDDLTPNGSTTQLAKKLAATHGTLLAEADIQRYLMKLQKLMRDGPPNRTQPAAAPSAAASGSTARQPQSGPNKADLGLLYRDPEAALRDVDLQDADEYTVKEFKAKMDEAFVTKVVKPGDPEYKYDNRKNFTASKKSEWDDDEDSDDF